eukprot:4324035-Prymnesium_polylepis.1
MPGSLVPISAGVKSSVLKAEREACRSLSPSFFSADHFHTRSSLIERPVVASRRIWTITSDCAYFVPSYVSVRVKLPPGSTRL